MKFLLISIILAPVLVLATGGEMGNGTDNPDPSENSAWFLADSHDAHKKFSYCYEVERSFGVSDAFIENTLETVLSTWTDYVQKKSVDRWSSLVGKRIVTLGQLKKSCNGSEDLKFYFGVSNPDVELRKQRYVNPTAFAFRSKFDLKTGWGKGFIWLAPPKSVNPSRSFPDWINEAQLTGILSHEFGHVLGCGHVSGTVMDEQLSSLIVTMGVPETSLKRIDYSKELVISENTSLYRGRISDPAIFQSLAGRASSGVVTAQLSSATGADDLQLSDGRGVFHLKIVYPKDSRTVFERSGDVFKGVFYFNGNITTHTSVSGQVYTDYGSARSAAGKQINIVREMNAEKPFPQDYSPTPGPVTLKILSDGRIQNLFTSETL